MNRSNRFLTAALLILVCGGAACLPKAKTQTVTTPGGVEIIPRALRMQLYELTTHLAGEIEEAADRIRAGTTDPQVFRNALVFKIDVIPTLYRAAFRSDPLLSTADVVLLAAQLHDYVTEGDGRALFGDRQGIMVDAVRRMDERVATFLDLYELPEDDGLDERVEQYAREHPIRGAISARNTVVVPLTKELRASKMGTFKAVGSLVGSVDDLSDRLAIYAQLMTRQARWEAEIAILDMGLNAVDVDGIVEDMASLGLAAERLTEFLDDVPLLVDEQIQSALPEVVTSFAEMDLEPIRNLFDELATDYVEIALDSVTGEREAVLQAVSQEREIIMADAERLILEATDRAFERVEAQIGAQLTRLVPLALAALLGPFVLGLLAGVVFARRRAAPAGPT
jgi:hypothetical protein